MADVDGKPIAATKRVAMQGVQLVVKYLLPIATGFLGLFTGAQTWGGLNAFQHAVASTNAGLSPKLVNYAGAGVFGGMFAAVGYGFWGLDGHLILTAAGRAFGAYFFGTALSYLIVAISGTMLGDGLIDNLVADLQGL